jgi:transposase
MVIVGVDTHGEVHVACALDQLGRQLATRQAATTPAGYRALLAWARSLGEVTAWGLRGPAAMGPPWPGFSTAKVRWCWK